MLKGFITALLLACFGFAVAAAPPPPASASQPASSAAVTQTVNSVKLNLLKALEQDKVLTSEQVKAATAKYIGSDSEIVAAAQDQESRWFSWVGALKVAAVLAFLIAFSGVIAKIVGWCWMIIVAVPTYIYQGAFLACTMWLTLFPSTVWVSQAFYLALFGAFGNIMIVSWILKVYPKVAMFIKNMFSLGIPPYVLASLYGALYFGVLAVAYGSQIFGFFTAVCVSAAFGFGLFYMPGVLFLDIRKNAVLPLFVSHVLILAAYVWAKQAGVPYLALFASGFEYYCPIALGLAMLVGVSPWYKEGTGVNALIAVVTALLALFAYSYFGEHGIGTIVLIFFCLLLAEWVMYASWHGGLIIGTAATGALLYGGALVLESNGRAILQHVMGG